MRKILLWLGLLLSCFAQSNLGFAQSKQLEDLRQELQALKAGQTAIQKDLLEIKNMLLQKEIQALREGAQARPATPMQGQVPAPQVFQISVADAPFKGDRMATLTLVDFTDYE